MKRSLKKVISLVLVASMILPLTGCSNLLKKLAGKDASKVLTATLDDFYNDPASWLESNSDSIEMPQITEAGMQLALEQIGNTSYELMEPKVNNNRDEAKITVKFSGVHILENVPMGTEDEVRDFIADSDTDDVEIQFVLSKKNKDWKITDMTGISEVFITPYASIAFVDENGMPTSFYQPFFDEVVVDTVWYDPVMGNPLNGRSMSQEEAIEAVVYFNTPMYLTFTANLYKNDELIQSIEVPVNGLTVANCDFWGERYTNGSYTCELVYDGGVVATSEALSVN